MSSTNGRVQKLELALGSDGLDVEARDYRSELEARLEGIASKMSETGIPEGIEGLSVAEVAARFLALDDIDACLLTVKRFLESEV